MSRVGRLVPYISDQLDSIQWYPCKSTRVPRELFSRGYQKYTQTLQLFFLNSAKRLSGTFRIWQALGVVMVTKPKLRAGEVVADGPHKGLVPF